MKKIVDEIKNLQELNGLEKQLPIHSKAVRFFENIVQFLFPIRSDKFNCDLTSCHTFDIMYEQLIELITILYSTDIEKNKTLAEDFFSTLPTVYKKLIEDGKLILANDPAAKNLEEIILSYPGFFAITTYRICHVLANLEIPILPRLISEYAHSKTGIDIHPSAKIAHPFFIDHGTGIVIGETCIIGKNVNLYQGVTLGAVFVKKELSSKKRHPTIEDNVVIYSNATILGGDTVIGHDSVIGGNVWLTKSLEPHSVVYYKSNVIIKKPNDNELMFHI